jgi:hypothetical protein
MEESLVTRVFDLYKEIFEINEFLLKDIAPDNSRAELTAKSCILLGELGDTIEQLKDIALCK